jgi:maltooligosyltrehalose trehalohydrolase
MNEISLITANSGLSQLYSDSTFGAIVGPTGTKFQLWAPSCEAVGLHIIGSEPIRKMERSANGWFSLDVEGASHGALYKFTLPDGRQIPDPASRFQPNDVHGPSEVIDPDRYVWKTCNWAGRPWEEAVIYELHIGTFTDSGTYLAAIEKLGHLEELGVTAIELLPVGDFPGRWNWGYDGVFPFAPDASYGRPEHLKAFIDAAHSRSMMVILDVVYNHFGPVGNYMPLCAPVVTEKYKTPWGAAVNFDDKDSAPVRSFFIENARYWLNEFRFDGLRFDAVHEIYDHSEKHVLQEMAESLRAASPHRHVHLIAENSKNEAGWLKRRKNLAPGLYTAQWSDDIHHGLHCAATGESHWYYADFHGRPDILARSLAEGLGYQGELMKYEGKPKGEPSAFLPPTAFVSYIQNHDQTGNRPFGDRITKIAAFQAVRTLAAINLLSPHVPLLFMGEEWGSRQPFMFFSDVGEELADAVRESRRKEFEASPDALWRRS